MQLTADQLARRMKPYQEGLNDLKIARAQGVHRATVRRWRISLGLARNCEPGSRKDYSGPVRALHATGLNDEQISRPMCVYLEFREHNT